MPIQNPDNDPNDPNAGYLSVVSPLPLETATASQRLEAIILTGNFSVGSINYDGTGAVLIAQILVCSRIPLYNS